MSLKEGRRHKTPMQSCPAGLSVILSWTADSYQGQRAGSHWGWPCSCGECGMMRITRMKARIFANTCEYAHRFALMRIGEFWRMAIPSYHPRLIWSSSWSFSPFLLSHFYWLAQVLSLCLQLSHLSSLCSPLKGESFSQSAICNIFDLVALSIITVMMFNQYLEIYHHDPLFLWQDS